MGILEIVVTRTGTAFAQRGKTREQLAAHLDQKKATDHQRSLAFAAFDKAKG